MDDAAQADTTQADAAAHNATTSGAGRAAEAPAQIPQAALARWQALPEDTVLTLALTRGDLDNLLLGLRTLAIGQNQVIGALAAHMRQDHEQAYEAVATAHYVCLSGFNKINALISAVMSAAAPAGTDPAA